MNKSIARLQIPLQNNFATIARLQTPIYGLAICNRLFNLPITQAV
jgi:hypothetical protein